MVWVKGQSGNPNGRAADASELKNMIKQHVPTAITKLLEAMNSDGKDRVTAAKIILEYGIGKPTQMIEHSGKVEGNIINVVAGFERNPGDS